MAQHAERSLVGPLARRCAVRLSHPVVSEMSHAVEDDPGCVYVCVFVHKGI